MTSYTFYFQIIRKRQYISKCYFRIGCIWNHVLCETTHKAHLLGAGEVIPGIGEVIPGKTNLGEVIPGIGEVIPGKCGFL